jgi:hypothetical protein
MSCGDSPVYVHTTATTGMLMDGKISVGVFLIAMMPDRTMRMLITTNVRGRRRATRTMAFM